MDEPEEIKLTTKQLNERLSRHSRSTLKEMWGTDDPEAIKAQRTRLQELEQQEETRKREQMTEIERHKADVAKEAARAAALEAELAETKFAGLVSDHCAKLGITNLKYAKYLAAEEADGLPAGQQLDVGEYLKKQLDDPQLKAALGLSPPVSVVQTPITTSPANPGGDPPPPAPGGGAGGKKAPKDMTPAEFNAHLATLR